MLINLMDYIAKDYSMGVQDGTVINEFEYAEMKEFVRTALTYSNKLIDAQIFAKDAGFDSKITQLDELIQSKANGDEVARTADQIKSAILSLNLIALAPLEWPNMADGEAVYSTQCASCHGSQGAGDGQAGVGLNPAPTNFQNKEIMSGVAPFQAFNTIRLGIPGTGMRAYSELSEKEIWNLAFYIESLQHLDRKTEKPTTSISLEELSALSDAELQAKYPELNVAAHRSNPTPDKRKAVSPTAIARQLLSESQEFYASSQFERAHTSALNAYLKGVEPIEPQIMASDNALFQELESSMMDIRSAIQSKVGVEEFRLRIERANTSLDKADELLGQKDRGLLMTAFLALSILLREGLEAFFVILAILGILKSVNAPRAIRWIHGGWITAVLCGLVGWFFADSLMNWNAQSRELMEGLIALFAVLVLLYLGFWLHGKTEASKWQAFVETRIKSLISKNNMVGLGAFSFVVVFREAFESVLFLSSLTSDGQPESRIGVLIGFIVSAILLFIMAWAILKWFKKLPISKVFLYSSMVILALAFVLAGQGIHAIQEGGYIDVHSFPINMRFPTLGIYPTYESLMTQLGVLITILLLWKISKSKGAVSEA